MSYLEIVKRALNGRSVNAAAKQWGIPQPTLDRYVKGRLPDYRTALRMAHEAGISGEEMLQTLAEEETKKVTKIEKSFNTLLRTANIYWTKTQQMA